MEDTTTKQMTIGVDYGGVCSIHDTTYENDKFSGEVGINMPDCVETLRELKERGYKLVLISFCGGRRAKATREYLRTLMLFDEEYYVKKRPYKANVCRHVGVHVMIDDRLDILQTIGGSNTKTVHFGKSKTDVGVKYKADHDVGSWADVLKLIEEMKYWHISPVEEVGLAGMCY